MTKSALGGLVLAMSLASTPSGAQPYSVHQTITEGVRVVRLEDHSRQTVVSIAPSVGNIAFEMKVNGKNVFWFPYESVADFARSPRLAGNPFLAPWANRIDQEAFHANGKRYRLNPDLGNLRRDGNQLPIHGLLLFASQWEVIRLEADATGARAVSRLDFYKHADLMAQFPFAHRIEMSYILREGSLEVRTRVENLGSETMPLSLGYHPYFEIHDTDREQWKVHLPAEQVWELNEELIPTGKTIPIRDVFPELERLQLRRTAIDHVLGGLIRDSAHGQAVFAVEGEREKIEVVYGRQYKVAVVYAPVGDDRRFICFEPMTGVTNAFNLAHRGAYGDLQSISPGEAWQESFWIRPSGF